MKTGLNLFAAAFLTGLLVIAERIQADPDAATDHAIVAPINAKALLEKGQAAGSLPKGMIVRVEACLGEPAQDAAGNQEPAELLETWEFTPDQVHRVVGKSRADKTVYNRIESRAFDTKNLCKDLLDGKAIETHARKGTGPEMGFVGTRYGRGSRFITVEWNGQTVLELFETNGAVSCLYRESDARAFGALYERLASQARTSFEAKPPAISSPKLQQ